MSSALGFQLAINSMAGEVLTTLTVIDCTLIADVKVEIQRKLGIPMQYQHITHPADVKEPLDNQRMGDLGLDASKAVLTLTKEAVPPSALLDTLRADLEGLLPQVRTGCADEDLQNWEDRIAFEYKQPDGTPGGKPKHRQKPQIKGFCTTECSEDVLTEYLLASGADPNLEVKEEERHLFGLLSDEREPDVGGTALHYAARFGRVEVCRQLLADPRFEKINLAPWQTGCRSALHLAGTTYNTYFNDGRESNRVEVCRLLVSDSRCNVDLEIPNCENYLCDGCKGAPTTPLFTCMTCESDEDRYDLCKFCIPRKDEIYPGGHEFKICEDLDLNCNGQTALCLSVMNCLKDEDVKKVDVLLSSGRCDCNKVLAKSGDENPIFACLEGDNRSRIHLKICQLFLHHEGINIYNQNGDSILSRILCYCIHAWGLEEEQFAGQVALEVVRHPGFDWQKEAGRNEPLLCLAARWGTPQLVRALLENHQVDPNQRSARREISSAGAEGEAVDEQEDEDEDEECDKNECEEYDESKGKEKMEGKGQTCEEDEQSNKDDEAEEANNDDEDEEDDEDDEGLGFDIAGKQEGSDACPVAFGQSVLHYAWRNGHFRNEILELVLQSDRFNIFYVTDDKGGTAFALHLAVRCGLSIEVIKLLLSRGIDISLKDERGHIAADYGSEEVKEFLRAEGQQR